MDITYLQELTEGDISVQKELIILFFDTADSALNTFSSDTDDSHLWKETAHELKGAALSLGFNELAEICAQAQSCQSFDSEFKQQFREKLTQYIAEIRNITLHLR